MKTYWRRKNLRYQVVKTPIKLYNKDYETLRKLWSLPSNIFKLYPLVCLAVSMDKMIRWLLKKLVGNETNYSKAMILMLQI